MPRRVVSHNAESFDREKLQVVTIYEEGVTKEQIKRMNPYTKRHEVLVKCGHVYEFMRKKA